MSIKKEYDDNGNLTFKIFQDSEGNVDYSCKYTYDDKGNKTS